MNELFAMPSERPTTQTAEGLPRWRWTVAELEQLAAANIFTDYDRFELLGGEIVPMSPKGRRHERIRLQLTRRFFGLAPAQIMVAPEPQFNLSIDTYAVPDILVHAAEVETYDLAPRDAVLAVEIADTSLSYDIKTKAALYAAHGVPEYWVTHAGTLVTTVHKEPSGEGYAFTQEIPSDTLLVPTLVPQLAVSMSDLFHE